MEQTVPLHIRSMCKVFHIVDDALLEAIAIWARSGDPTGGCNPSTMCSTAQRALLRDPWMDSGSAAAGG
jgi:hypothetical protein